VRLLRFNIRFVCLLIFDPVHANFFNWKDFSHFLSFSIFNILFSTLDHRKRPNAPAVLSPSPSPRGSARRLARTGGRRAGTRAPGRGGAFTRRRTWTTAQRDPAARLLLQLQRGGAPSSPRRLGVLVQRQPLVSRRWRCRTWGDHHDWGRRDELPMNLLHTTF
jgi:hypothetical protein